MFFKVVFFFKTKKYNHRDENKKKHKDMVEFKNHNRNEHLKIFKH